MFAYRHRLRRQHRRHLVVFAALVCFSTILALDVPSYAQRYRINYRNGAVSDLEARRQQMKKMWYTSVEVDRTRGGVNYITQNVSFQLGATVFDILHAGKVVRSFSQRERDQYGDVLGIEGAKQRAKSFADRIRIAGKEAKVVETVIPDVTILASSSGGLVHAIDGETGQTRWAVNYGNRNYPTLEASANDQYVAIVNGSTLYIADRKNGRMLWSRRLRGVPAAGPVLTESMVFVSAIGGAVEAYSLDDPKGKVGYYNSAGRVEVRPTATRDTISWVTDRGMVYTADANNIGVRYSREIGRPIDAGVGYGSPHLLFVATIDGFLECLDENRLASVWKLAIGEPVYRTPTTIGDNVYLTTDTGGLYSLSAKTGHENWYVGGIKGFVSAAKNRIYCVDNLGRIVIIDMNRGGRLGVLNTQGADVKMVNRLTDRIVVASRTGLIQCFREIAQIRPYVHFAQEKKVEPAKPKKPSPEAKPPTEAPKPAGAGDPFSGGVTPAADDPFSGGGGDPSSDPFGM